MWFVRAVRNKKKVLLPAWNGKQEAINMRKHLTGYGWDAKIVAIESNAKVK